MTADVISFGSKAETPVADTPESTDASASPDVWQQAATIAVLQKAKWGALIFSDEEGEVRAIWINTDRPSFRGLVEEIRDELRMQLAESHA